MEFSFPSTFFVFIFIFIFMFFSITFIHAQKPAEADIDGYEACNQTFDCGNIPNLGYPFYGKSSNGPSRPAYCGHPGFQLDCTTQKGVPQIKISSQNYYVHGINESSHTLNLSRDEDYYTFYCDYQNTTIDFSLFSYSHSENISFYYDCSSKTPPWSSFNCGDKRGYFMTAEMEGSYGYGMSGYDCRTNVALPVMESVTEDLDPNQSIDLLNGTLRVGFELKWNASNSLCDDCVKSSGRCGYDHGADKFTCFCRDKAYDHKCPGKSLDKSLVIGVSAAGAGILAAFLVLGSFFIAKRRRQLASQAQSKGLGPTTQSSELISTKGFHSSQGAFTTSRSANLSQSIPSYPSSLSGIGNGSCYFGIKVFSYNELEEATDNFNEARELGDGGFGAVYYGQLRDGRTVAVKRLFENSMRRIGQFMNEIEILARLRHDNLVILYGCTSRHSRELLLVYEYISNGTVADHLHGKLAPSNSLTWPIRLNIAIQTADALAYLHKSDVIHRDVKTTNILLESNFQVKVADFGLSRLFPNDVTHVSTAPQGTPGYVDPEYYNCYRLTERSDVYSFGVVLIELISSKPAVDIMRHRHDVNLANMAIDRIQNHTLHELVDPNLGYDNDNVVQKMVKSVAELAFRCLQQDRDARPCMDEVAEALKGIKNEVINTQKQVVVDIQADEDDIGLLKNVPPPLSPETQVNNTRSS